MIGKILLYVFVVLFLLLLIALRIPAFIRITYEQGQLCSFIKYAWMTIPLYPKKKEKTRKTQGEIPPAETATEKEAKQKQKINRDQILYTLDTLPTVVLKAIKRFGKRIRIEPLKIHVLVATPDPADTAILYGKIQSVLATVMPILHQHIKIREQDIQLFTDFCEEDMDCIVDAGIGIAPGDVLLIAFGALGGMMKWLIGFRKRASKEPSVTDNNRDITAQADKAA